MLAKTYEFWRCPTCKQSYWTLHARERLFCAQAVCGTRCVPSSFASFIKPVQGAPLAGAWVSTFDPEIETFPDA